ncbi:complex I subunit 1 family protein [Thermogladius sp. 4427co]|uniref:complex I subunit 1 family protein n=1 Tax=Thermogladius sp. 4427co TaxID=3450718 RepID=UPI003F799DB0
MGYIYLVIAGIILTFAYIMIAQFLEWVERKTIARLQRRIGPFYTGPFGLLQPYLDILKLLFKEEVYPADSELAYLRLGIMLATVAPLFGLMFIPVFSPIQLIGSSSDWIAIFIAFAILTLSLVIIGLYSITPFTLVGTGRLIVQYSLYEFILLATITLAFVQASTTSISGLLSYEFEKGPIIIYQPLGFIVSVYAVIAKLEKPPFDLPHAKQEIAAGWLTELSSRNLAFAKLSRNLDMLYTLSLITLVFLGGGEGPFSDTPFLWGFYFMLKLVMLTVLIAVIEALSVRSRYVLLPRRLWLFSAVLIIIQYVGVLAFKWAGYV